MRRAYVRLQVLTLCCVGGLSVAGCSRPVDSSRTITVEHAWSPGPPQVGPATVVLKLADKAARPISGAGITLEADMSHAGMACVLEEARETDPGRYQAHLKFAMAGDWVILLHVRLPGGQTLQRQFHVAGVRPH